MVTTAVRNELCNGLGRLPCSYSVLYCVILLLLPLEYIKLGYLFPHRLFHLFFSSIHNINFFNSSEQTRITNTHFVKYEANSLKMLDPVGFEAAFMKTSSLLVPTPSPTPSVSPIPSVIPNVPHFERIGDAGTKTLWVSRLLGFPFAGLTIGRSCSSSCFYQLLPSLLWHGESQL